jgi:hypothetical protein
VLFKERYEDTKGAIKNGKSKIPKAVGILDLPFLIAPLVS